MIRIKEENIQKVISKWTPIAHKIDVEDIPNWCLCLEQSCIHLNAKEHVVSVEDSSNYLPLVAKTLDRIIKEGIQIRHTNDKILNRKFIIENLDGELDYEEFLESIQEKCTYKAVIDRNQLDPLQDVYYNLSVDITRDIVEKSNGRTFVPFEFIRSLKIEEDIVIVKCRYGFV